MKPWMPILAVGSIAGAVAGQSTAALSPSGRRLPDDWRPEVVASVGVEFRVPPGFRKRPARSLRVRSFQGRLGGAPVRLHLNIGPANKFCTVSRYLLASGSAASVEEVFGLRVDGEAAALVKRRTKNPRRITLELVACPRRRAVSLELQFENDVEAPALVEGARLLRCLAFSEPRKITIASRAPEIAQRAEIELGFPPRSRDRVEILQSRHYRLYSSAPGGKKLLRLLEEQLLPRLAPLTGPVPFAFTHGRLPVFLHLTQEEYEAAALLMNIPQELAQVMPRGYAWDRYYATYYKDTRDPIHIHEGTHQYVTAVLGLDGGGPWLQEGLAQWLEAEFARRDPVRVAHNLLRKQRDGFPSLRSLVGARTLLGPLASETSKTRLSNSERYDLSASLVRFLIEEYHNDFQDLLLQVGVLPRGRPKLVEEAFRRSIRRDLEETDAAWRAWLRRR